MPPRKSSSRQIPEKAISVSLMPPPTTPSSFTLASSTRSARGQQGVATPGVPSSSRVTLDASADVIPAVNLPITLTPGYKPLDQPGVGLDEEERGRLIHELVGFYPRTVCERISEEARLAAIDVTNKLDAYLAQLASGTGERFEREADTGLYAFETLVSNHIDKAFDKFTAWALRNPFDVPDDIEVVLPWCKDLDFDRGAYVAALPGGEEGLMASLEELRQKVEQMRYLSQQLESAEKALDRRLEIARQRKAEVGFIQEVLAGANLTPLAPSLKSTKNSLLALQSVLETMPDPHPSGALSAQHAQGQVQGVQGQKAWEMGRQAYLAWAVGKAIAATNATGSEVDVEGGAPVGVASLEGVEAELKGVGKAEDLERVMKGM